MWEKIKGHFEVMELALKTEDEYLMSRANYNIYLLLKEARENAKKNEKK